MLGTQSQTGSRDPRARQRGEIKVIWIGILTAILVLVVIAWALLSEDKPVVYEDCRPEDLPDFFRALADFAVPGSLLTLDHQGSPAFFQFIKEADSGQSASVLFGLPVLEWSRDHVDQLKLVLNENGHDVLTVPHEDGTVMITVKLDPTEEAMGGLFRLVLEPLGISSRDQFSAVLEGVYEPSALRDEFLRTWKSRRGQASSLTGARSDDPNDLSDPAGR